uniref:D-aminopeptidase n=1 Tax=Paenirhodobacter enshiensis TaxID=1105367 RepID=UPI0035B07463
MTDLNLAAAEALLDTLPARLGGPGGLAGVVHEGRIVMARAWGYADLEAGRPMTRRSRLPVCSISKQFTCGAVLAALGSPEALDDRVADWLPAFEEPRPSARNLCNNQSGLRDYWALTVLDGARAEQEFPRGAARPLIARMKTGHFAPGTSYSYCNANFRILGDMLSEATGRDLAELYRTLIWDPAGMDSAALTPDTRHPVDGVTGYEGAPDHGFLPAHNGVWWQGDAGISASLDDMLAWECWIDATREDAGSVYRRLSEPQTFADGAAAGYGFGLARETVGRAVFTGHGGALRGFRLYRMNARAERLSVVVMLNHEGDAHGAAVALARAALGVAEPVAPLLPEGWDGIWLDRERGMVARIVSGRRSATLHYATRPLSMQFDGEGLSAPGTTIRRDGTALSMALPGENTVRRLIPLEPLPHASGDEISGLYESPEPGSRMRIEARDGAVFATFEGTLGQGRPEPMTPVARDIWRLTVRRSMDAPAPGEWTFTVSRDAAGRVTGGTLSVWLARGIRWRRL